MGYPIGLGGQKWGTPSAPGTKNSKKIDLKKQRNKKEGGTPQSRSILIEKVANMAPTWVPKWSQDGQKIDAKKHHFFDASWNRSLGGFWWILGAKIEPSWHPNGIKNRCQLRKACFQKIVVFLMKN